MTTTLELLGGFPKTKAEIQSAITTIKDDILGGYHDPLVIDLHLKKMEEVINGVRKDKEIQAAVYATLEKYTEKTIRENFCEVTKTSRSTYNYDLCNDIELQILEREAEKVNTALKDRQKFLQALRNEMVIVTADGEVATIYPPARMSTESYSIKIL